MLHFSFFCRDFLCIRDHRFLIRCINIPIIFLDLWPWSKLKFSYAVMKDRWWLTLKDSEISMQLNLKDKISIQLKFLLGDVKDSSSMDEIVVYSFLMLSLYSSSVFDIFLTSRLGASRWSNKVNQCHAYW